MMRKFKLSSIMQYAASQHIIRSGYRYATLLLLLLMAMGGATKAQTYWLLYYNATYSDDKVARMNGTELQMENSTFDMNAVWTVNNNGVLQNYNGNYLQLTRSGNGSSNNNYSYTFGGVTSNPDATYRLNAFSDGAYASGSFRLRNNSYNTTTLYFRSNSPTLNSNNNYYVYRSYQYSTSQQTFQSIPIISGLDVAVDGTQYTASGAVYLVYTIYHPNGLNNNTAYDFYDVNGTKQIIAPTASDGIAYDTYTWLIVEAEHDGVSIGETNGVIDITAMPEDDMHLTLRVVATSSTYPSYPSLENTKSITILGYRTSAPTISRSGNEVTLSADAGATIYYTTDGSDPTTSDTRIEYTGSFTLSEGNTTIRATATRDGSHYYSSTQTYTYQVDMPVITINNSNGSTTITCGTEGATIYYTIDGTNPTTGSTPYSNAFTVSSGTEVRAIAVKANCTNSDVATALYATTSVIGTVVTLNDFEDHTWSYYQDNNDLPTGYPTGYLNSPDPRNVIIDYRGVDLEGNLSANVAISGLTGENQNEMIYYKTLEKTVLGMTGNYPYTVISNPFSKRPKSGSTYYGFAGWKVKSGGEYIAEYSNNDVIPLDATIHFTNLNTNYSPNCISATVVLEATWTEATVKTGTSAQTFSGGTYETNFWLVNGDINSDVTVNSPCTVTMMSPDGGATVNNRGTYTISRSINPGTDHVKVEFVRMNHTNAVNINGYDYIIGRGVIGVNNSNTGGDIQGCSSNKECTHTFKIESGTYSSLHNFTSNINTNRIIDQLMILGCDYDRAKGDNSKLIIKGDMYGGYGIQLNRTSNDLYLRGVIKSGTFQSNVTVGGNGNYKGSGGTQSYYFSVASIHNAGRRFLTVEGGRLAGIAGGMDETNNQDTTARSFDLRVRGTAQIDGVVYGAAEYANGKGTRVMVFTGGTINGWIAGGANGTQESNGALWGSAYLYVGGKTQVVNDDDYPNQVMNRGVGGNVFGAGCGYSTTSTSGQVTLGTNVVVSDEAVVDRGVYGGGSFGYCTTNQTANVFILGGKVNGKDGGVNGTNYSSSIQGGVFGGACQNNGGEVNILMTDGTVMGGVYGGSNSSGTIAENAVVTVYGGTVGSQSDSANVHGGGLGSSTYITKNVTVTIGKDCDNGPMIYGDVHGGSAQGTVNGTEGSHAYTNNNTTSVSVAGGTMHDVFGGGLGTNLIAATVCGRVTVNVTGGIISNVFGGNNVNGQPLGSSIVTINYAEGCGTTSCGNSVNYAIKEAVYGGGRGAAYDYTNGTVVNFQNGSAAAVYGGGLGANASVKKTSVTMTGGTVGNVFGGGNAGPVGTAGTAATVVSTTVSVLNGTVCNNVYGGGNAATVNGSTRVNIGEECISN